LTFKLINAMEGMNINPLKCLIGEQLSAVQFVQDYLELHFDGNGLTCYIWPEVYKNDLTFRFGEVEYRNKLCELIGEIVQDVLLVEGNTLTIIFLENQKINLSLDQDNPEIVAEIAIFTNAEGNISIFE